MSDKQGSGKLIVQADGPRVVILRGDPVMLNYDVAEAFGVETRKVTQAISRNPKKFTPVHAFKLSEEEFDGLRSQGVISSSGHGGRRYPPWALTQKGVARLATVLNSPKALEATDLIIDLFLEVYMQVRQGRTEVEVSNPSRFVATQKDVKKIRNLRRKLVDAVESLLNTVVDTRTQSTVGDELGEVANEGLSHIKELLKTRRLGNEKIAAETLKIIEQTRDIYERRQIEIIKSHAEIERTIIENLKLKIEIVEQLLDMTDRLEPNAMVRLLPSFAEPKALPPAPAQINNGDRED